MRIYLVYLLNVLNTASNYANRIFLALLAVKLGASPVYVGVLAAAFSVFPTLLAVTAGRLHDRFGSRRLLLLTAGFMSAGMLVPAFWPSLAAILVAALACGLSNVFFNVCTQNLTGLLATPETRTRNFANYSLSNSIGHFLGPLTGGFAIDHLSNANACLVLAAFAASPILVLMWRRRPLEPSSASSRQVVKGEKKAAPAVSGKGGKGGGGAWDMLANPAVRTTLYVGCLFNAALALYQFYVPVYLNSLGIAASVIGLIVAMHATAAFLVRLVLPKIIQKLNENRVLVIAFTLAGAAVAAMPLFANPWVLGLLCFLFGLAIGIGNPIVNMQMFTNSPAGRSGEAIGLKMTTNNITKLAGPIVFGAVAAAFGLGATFWLNALMLGSGGILSRPRKAPAAGGGTES